MLASAHPLLQEYIEGINTPLDPVLAKHVGTVGEMGLPALRHPLVYSIPFMSMECRRVNDFLAYKRELLRKAAAKRAFFKYVNCYERPYRIEGIRNFLRRHPDYGLHGDEREQFWETVAWAHTDSENILTDLRKWTHLWTRQHPSLLGCRHLASGDDWAKLEALGDRIEVFHGNTEGGAIDLSWSLSYDMAAWFARRFGASKPVVYHGWVKRSDVIAYLTRRDEDELVIERKHVAVHTVEPIKRKPTVRTEDIDSSALFQSINSRRES